MTRPGPISPQPSRPADTRPPSRPTGTPPPTVPRPNRIPIVLAAANPPPTRPTTPRPQPRPGPAPRPTRTAPALAIAAVLITVAAGAVAVAVAEVAWRLATTSLWAVTTDEAAALVLAPLFALWALTSVVLTPPRRSRPSIPPAPRSPARSGMASRPLPFRGGGQRARAGA